MHPLTQFRSEQEGKSAPSFSLSKQFLGPQSFSRRLRDGGGGPPSSEVIAHRTRYVMPSPIVSGPPPAPTPWAGPPPYRWTVYPTSKTSDSIIITSRSKIQARTRECLPEAGATAVLNAVPLAHTPNDAALPWTHAGNRRNTTLPPRGCYCASCGHRTGGGIIGQNQNRVAARPRRYRSHSSTTQYLLAAP